MNLDHFLKSPLVNINFAGFRASSLQLQNAGWQLSASEDFSYRTGYREIQIMLHHSSGGLTMVSRMQLMNVDFMMRNEGLKEAFIIGVHVGGRTTFVERPEFIDIDFSTRPFVAVDATPSFERVDLSTIDLRKFGIFKKINDSVNIFMPEKTIDELMKEIIEKQVPRQQQIRKNNNRREFMQDFNRNPNEEIRLQLVAV